MRDMLAASLQSTREMFLSQYGERVPMDTDRYSGCYVGEMWLALSETAICVTLHMRVSSSLKLAVKIRDEYNEVKDLPPPRPAQPGTAAAPVTAAASKATVAPMDVTTGASAPTTKVDRPAIAKVAASLRQDDSVEITTTIEDVIPLAENKVAQSKARQAASAPDASNALVLHTGSGTAASQALVDIRAGLPRARKVVQPEWHAPWKLMRVITGGHKGWVTGLTVDVSNEWFVSGSADRTIKIWYAPCVTHLDDACGDMHLYDVVHLSAFSSNMLRVVLVLHTCYPRDLASGSLKLTLTGHVNTVQAVTVSDRHPYLFSVGLDKKVICWDLEQNKAIRSYHGHLSGVYSVALHPTLDLLITGGRDSTARVNTASPRCPTVVECSDRCAVAYFSVVLFRQVWDIRTKSQVHVLAGHTDTVASLVTQSTEPQVITGSHDSTIRLWDIASGRTVSTLTHHKKSSTLTSSR